MNDGPVRAELVRALGYCPYHAWLIQHLEQSAWRDGLGVGILYEDFLGRALCSLAEYLREVRTESEVRRFIAEVELERVKAFNCDLSEYVRKQNWSYRDEPKHTAEFASRSKALAFCVGDDDERGT